MWGGVSAPVRGVEVRTADGFEVHAAIHDGFCVDRKAVLLPEHRVVDLGARDLLHEVLRVGATDCSGLFVRAVRHGSCPRPDHAETMSVARAILVRTEVARFGPFKAALHRVLTSRELVCTCHPNTASSN